MIRWIKYKLGLYNMQVDDVMLGQAVLKLREDIRSLNSKFTYLISDSTIRNGRMKKLEDQVSNLKHELLKFKGIKK